MTTALVICAGQSLMVPITDTNTVPNEYLTNQWLAWTRLGYNYSIPPLNYKRSPWQPVRQKKGVSGHRDAIGCDAAITKQLTALGVSGGMIHFAFGGSSLAVDWAAPNGPLYVALTQEITLALSSSLSPVGSAANLPVLFFWEQGQTDAVTTAYSNAYAANLATFTTAIRSFLAPRTTHFIIMQTTANATGSILFAPQANLNAVRAAQASFVAGDGGLSALVDDTSFTTFDGVHLTQSGSIAQGIAAANAAFSLL